MRLFPLLIFDDALDVGGSAYSEKFDRTRKTRSRSAEPAPSLAEAAALIKDKPAKKATAKVEPSVRSSSGESLDRHRSPSRSSIEARKRRHKRTSSRDSSERSEQRSRTSPSNSKTREEKDGNNTDDGRRSRKSKKSSKSRGAEEKEVKKEKGHKEVKTSSKRKTYSQAVTNSAPSAPVPITSTKPIDIRDFFDLSKPWPPFSTPPCRSVPVKSTERFPPISFESSEVDARGFPLRIAEVTHDQAMKFARYLFSLESEKWDVEYIFRHPIDFYRSYYDFKAKAQRLTGELRDKIRKKNFEITRHTNIPFHLVMTADQAAKRGLPNSDLSPAMPPRHHISDRIKRLTHLYSELCRSVSSLGGVQLTNYVHDQVLIPSFEAIREHFKMSECDKCFERMQFATTSNSRENLLERKLDSMTSIDLLTYLKAENFAATTVLKRSVPQEETLDKLDPYTIGMSEEDRQTLVEFPEYAQQEYLRYIEACVHDCLLPKDNNTSSIPPIDPTCSTQQLHDFLAHARRKILREAQSDIIQFLHSKHIGLTHTFGVKPRQ